MDNSYGKGVGDTAPNNPKGSGMAPTKGGAPMRAAPPHKHMPQKPAHEVGAMPMTPATSDCVGSVPDGLACPDMN
jgi:hypothetical protein